jgi:hypothetical protein
MENFMTFKGLNELGIEENKELEKAMNMLKTDKNCGMCKNYFIKNYPTCIYRKNCKNWNKFIIKEYYEK